MRVIPRLMLNFLTQSTTHTKISLFSFSSSIMNKNTTRLNESDPGSYTYNTPLKEEEYVNRLMALGDSKITLPHSVAEAKKCSEPVFD